MTSTVWLRIVFKFFLCMPTYSRRQNIHFRWVNTVFFYLVLFVNILYVLLDRKNDQFWLPGLPFLSELMLFSVQILLNLLILNFSIESLMSKEYACKRDWQMASRNYSNPRRPPEIQPCEIQPIWFTWQILFKLSKSISKLLTTNGKSSMISNWLNDSSVCSDVKP